MMSNIKILDCTLRDGGYVNNWRFGENNIHFILKKLLESNIDIIEYGFFKPQTHPDKDTSIYNQLSDFQEFTASSKDCQFSIMVNFGECSPSDFPCNKSDKSPMIRVAFHKDDLLPALELCEEIQSKGYIVSIQPMNTIDYSNEELNSLLSKSNMIHPWAVYIVDSFGTLKPNQLSLLYEKYCDLLDKPVRIGFHSHNNLQMSFTNAQFLIQNAGNRQVIIDSSVLGMGRGAGNLCTELLSMYLNENLNTKYDLIPILEIVDNCISTIFSHHPWGYSMPYYLASINECHPNYATYLTNKQTIGVKTINEILQKLPANFKKKYNQEKIETLYLQQLSNTINDEDSISTIKHIITGRDILILAPGKSIAEQNVLIHEYIRIHKSLVISVNFTGDFNPDVLFYSNIKRADTIDFELMKRQGKHIISTSNIPDGGGSSIVVNYSSLTDPQKGDSDNACIMLLRLLLSIGKKRVVIAGFDGFSTEKESNHYCNDRNIVSLETLKERNKNISIQLKELMVNMQIHFLTPSCYVDEH